MHTITACIITKNEEESLGRCLESVSWADEIIVVDSGSTDRTLAIAKEAGATVLHRDWDYWARQKQFAIEHAQHDWIISLDADEYLEKGAEKPIRAALAQEGADSFALPRKTFFLGRWIAHAGWYPDQQVRIFRKSVTTFADVPVHEKVSPTPQTKPLAIPILHESYKSLTQFFEKNNAYTSAQAKQQQTQSAVGVKLILKPWYRFLQTYLFQLGFLDGWQGFVLAILRMWYEFVVLAKILEIRKGALPSTKAGRE